MTLPDVAPRRCHNCAEILVPPGEVCAKCGTRQAAQAPPPPAQFAPQSPVQFIPQPPPQFAAQPPAHVMAAPPHVIVTNQKSVGLAIVLSLLWFGAGQLYVGRRVGLAVVLLLWDAVLAFLDFTLIGAVIGIPLWLISVPFVLWLAANDANAYNENLLRA